MKKQKLLILILFVGLLFSLALNVLNQNKIKLAQDTYTDLQIEYDLVKGKIYKLERAIQNIESANNDVESIIQDLEWRLSDLE